MRSGTGVFRRRGFLLKGAIMFRLQAVAALVLCAAAFPAPARDVSHEQSAVQYARQQFEQAETEHRADQAQAEQTGKALDQLRKQLDAEQKKARLSEKNRQQAKAKLERAQAALERAWKQ
jgi:septal ring factor EnvC (AmiA/AmiB activator)